MEPRNNSGLNGILNWSLAQGAAGDGTVPSQRASEEDRAWLASALQSMSVDEAQRMRDLGACLRETVAHPLPTAVPLAGALAASALLALPGAAEAEASLGAYKLAALEELQDLVESIDNAKDVFMVGAVGPLFDAVRGAPPTLSGGGDGGGPPLLTLRGTTPPSVRAQACLVVATVVQNNPAAQAWALGAGALPLLLGALSCEGGEGGAPRAALALRAAAMGALSALLRDCRAAQGALLGPAGAGLGALCAPLSKWRSFCAAGEGGCAADDDGGAAAAAGRKLARRALTLLRHLASGTQPEAALAALLSAPTAPGALPALAAVLQCGLPAGGAPELSDALDARAAAVGCLLALASPAECLSAGVDDLQGDTRKPRGLFDGKEEGAGEGGAVGGAAPGALLLGNGGGGGGSPPAAAVPAFLSLSTRRTALQAAGVPALLQRHAQWCKARAELFSGAGDEGLAEAYAEEAAAASAATAAAVAPA